MVAIAPQDQHRRPGPKMPEKYAPTQVGPQYMHWGEQPGYIYNPYTDKYTPDPKTQQDLGLAPKDPKQAGLLDIALPIGVAAGGLAAGSYLGEQIPSALGGLLGGGGATSGLATSSGLPVPNIISATQSAAPASAAQGAGGGFLGLNTPGWLASGDPLAGQASGLLPYAGAALGAYGMYDLLSDPQENAFGGALQGAASGAAIGSVVPGVGTAIGAGIGGLIGLGSSLFGYHESGREKMQKRIGALQGKGVRLPDFVKANPSIYGLSKEELVAREQQKVEQGIHGNPQFAASRNEADLKPKDTWGGLMWFEEFGNDYLEKATEEQRLQMNQQALEEGIISEGRGQLSFTDKDRAREIWKEIIEGKQPEEEEDELSTEPTVGEPAAA